MIHPSSSTNKLSQWKPPQPRIIKLNVDAFFDQFTNQLGTSIGLRDFAGTCEGIKGYYADGVLSSEAGECMAIREAMLWAKEKHLTKIHIKDEAKLVIQCMTEKTLLIHWENINILKEIKHLISSFSYCFFYKSQ